VREGPEYGVRTMTRLVIDILLFSCMGVSGAPLQPGYTHRLVVLPGGLGNLGRPTEPHFNGLLQSTILINLTK